jgi:hypothetical protein
MDHGQGQRGIAILLSDRRQDANLAMSDLKNGLVVIALAVSDFDAMEPFDADLVHFVGDGVIPVSSQAVDAGPDQEMSSDLLCCAEKLVGVALAITDMDASSRMIQELRRLLEILQPSDVFLFLDGNPGRIDLLFQRCRSLEFLPGPELNGRQPRRHPRL